MEGHTQQAAAKACSPLLDVAAREELQMCWLAEVEKGATAAVFGLGTVGLACVDALRDVGASR